MNTNDLTTKAASQTTNVSSQPLMGVGVPTFPLPGAAVPSFNYAIAMQQYQFQQSLVSQQLLAQQQAVAHAVSIKAAAEQATARAAEISKLLNGEKDDVPKEKAEESKLRRESSESKSRSPSPRSNSKSPIRYSNRRKEHEEYSPRDGYSYRSRRNFGYNNRYRRDFYRSDYRRNAYHPGGRSYLHYRRSRSRNRGRSPSLSRSLRYRRDDSRSPKHRRDDSRSPKHRRVRSPSPNSRESRRRISSRVSNRRSMSRSLINDSSISPRPRSRILSPNKPRVRRSLSSSGNSPSRSTTSLLVKDNRVDQDVSSSENKNGFKKQGKEPRPTSKHLTSESFNSSSRSRSTSTDYSGKRNTQEPSCRKIVPDKFISATGSHSSSASSDGGSLRRTLGANDDESGSLSSLQRPTGDTDYPTRETDRPPSRKYADNRHDETGIVNIERQYLPNSVMGRIIDQDSMKPPSINKLSLSPEDSLSDHGAQKMYDEGKENIGADCFVARERHHSKESTQKNMKLSRREHELLPKVCSSSEDGSAYSEDKETDDRTNGKYHRRTCSEDVTTMEDDVNDRNDAMRRGASNHEVDISGHPRTPAEYAVYPLPDSHESMDGKLLPCRSPEEANQVRGFDVKISPTLPNEAAKADTEQVLTSPNVCQYPERRSKHMSRSRSRERRRKHSKRHHKRPRREEFEEGDDHKKESRRELKLKRHEKKDHKKHCKSRKESKRKRKHRDSSSCSSDDSSSSSSGDEYRKVYKVSSKRSTGSRKKRKPSPAASTSSS